jgi:putative spermidine/putrescine transport system ATP-binding protein
MAFIELRSVSKTYKDNPVVRDLSISVEKGEFLSLLGGSGCGKTTTLRMIAGFESPSSGAVFVAGQDVSAVPPAKRRLGMVFQNYALFPNMTVARNIGFGLRVARRSRGEISRRVAEMLELIGMGEFAHRYPHQLSGGQQQRVALARAVAVQPAALLLDEPLSALDAKIRVRLREEIRTVQQKLGITTIYVTHDQEEALSISDRVAVMREGVIEQIGTPFEIYNRPATAYVASFIGTLNVLAARAVDPAAGILTVDGQEIRAAGPFSAPRGGPVRLSLRPEALALGTGESGSNRLKGRLEGIRFLGSIVRLTVSTGGNSVSVDRFNDPRLVPPVIGDELIFNFPPEACIVVPSEAAIPGARRAADELEAQA